MIANAVANVIAKTLTPMQGLLVFVGYMMFIYTMFGLMIAWSNSLLFIIPQAVCILGGLLIIVWKVKPDA